MLTGGHWTHLAALSADTLIACLRYRPIEACPTFARGGRSLSSTGDAAPSTSGFPSKNFIAFRKRARERSDREVEVRARHRDWDERRPGARARRADLQKS